MGTGTLAGNSAPCGAFQLECDLPGLFHHGSPLFRPRELGVRLAVRLIEPIMTPLTARHQIFIPVVLGLMVEVHCRETHNRAGNRVPLTVPCLASPAVILPAFAMTFALTLRALKPDAIANRWPIGGVSVAVLRADWHRDRLALFPGCCGASAHLSQIGTVRRGHRDSAPRSLCPSGPICTNGRSCPCAWLAVDSRSSPWHWHDKLGIRPSAARAARLLRQDAQDFARRAGQPRSDPALAGKAHDTSFGPLIMIS